MAWIINTIFFISACFLTIVYSTTQPPEVATSSNSDFSSDSILISTDSGNFSSTAILPSTSDAQSNEETHTSSASLQPESTKQEEANTFLTSEKSPEFLTTPVANSVDLKQDDESIKYENSSDKDARENLNKDYIYSDNTSSIVPKSASEDKLLHENSSEMTKTAEEKKSYTDTEVSSLTSTVAPTFKENVEKLSLEKVHSESHSVPLNEASETKSDTDKAPSEASSLDGHKSSTTELPLNSEMIVSTERNTDSSVITTAVPEPQANSVDNETLHSDSHKEEQDSLSDKNSMSTVTDDDMSKFTDGSHTSFDESVTKAAMEKGSSSISKVSEKSSTSAEIIITETTDEELPETTSVLSFAVDTITTEAPITDSDTEESITEHSVKRRRAVSPAASAVSRSSALSSNQNVTGLKFDDELIFHFQNTTMPHSEDFTMLLIKKQDSRANNSELYLNRTEATQDNLAGESTNDKFTTLTKGIPHLKVGTDSVHDVVEHMEFEDEEHKKLIENLTKQGFKILKLESPSIQSSNSPIVPDITTMKNIDEVVVYSQNSNYGRTVTPDISSQPYSQLVFNLETSTFSGNTPHTSEMTLKTGVETSTLKLDKVLVINPTSNFSKSSSDIQTEVITKGIVDIATSAKSNENTDGSLKTLTTDVKDNSKSSNFQSIRVFSTSPTPLGKEFLSTGSTSKIISHKDPVHISEAKTTISPDKEDIAVDNTLTIDENEYFMLKDSPSPEIPSKFELINASSDVSDLEDAFDPKNTMINYNVSEELNSDTSHFQNETESSNSQPTIIYPVEIVAANPSFQKIFHNSDTPTILFTNTSNGSLFPSSKEKDTLTLQISKSEERSLDDSVDNIKQLTTQKTGAISTPLKTEQQQSEASNTKTYNKSETSGLAEKNVNDSSTTNETKKIAAVAIKTTVSVSLNLSKANETSIEEEQLSLLSNETSLNGHFTTTVNETADNLSIPLILSNPKENLSLQTSVRNEDASTTSTAAPTTTQSFKVRKPRIRIPGAKEPRVTRAPFLKTTTKRALNLDEATPVSIFKKSRSRIASITSSTTPSTSTRFNINIAPRVFAPDGALLPLNYTFSIEPETTTETTTEEFYTEEQFEDEIPILAVSDDYDVVLLKVRGAIVITRGIRWKKQLQYRKSNEYMIQARKIYGMLTRLFRNTTIALRLWKIEIDGFSEISGTRSVVVDFVLYIIKTDEEIDSSSFAKMFNEQLINGTFYHFRLNPSLTEFEMPMEERLNKPTEVPSVEPPIPQWAIAVIVIGAASLIFIILFGAVTVYGRHHMRRRYTNKLNEEDIERSIDSREWENKMGAAYENLAADSVYDCEEGSIDNMKRSYLVD